jgi:hypothetical protein
MEELALKKQLEDLSRTLRKYAYEIIIRDHDWMLVAKLRKPRTLIIYLAFFLGVLHLARKQQIIAMLDFLFGIAFIFMTYFSNKKYELLNTDIEHMLIAADGIHVQYLQNKGSLLFPADQIDSLAVDVQYNGNNSIASILLTDINGVKHELACMMSKNENAVTATAQAIAELMQSTINVKGLS